MKRFRPLELVLLFVFGPIVGGVLVNGLICVGVAFAIADFGGVTLQEAGSDPAAMSRVTAAVERAVLSLPVTTLNLALTAFFFIVPPVAYAAYRKLPVADTFGIVRPRSPAHFFLAPLGVLALGPVSDGLVRAMQTLAPRMTFGALEQIETMVRATPAALAVFLFAAFPGVGEEFLFRGFLQRALGRGALAIALSAVLFAAIHVDPHHVVGVLPVGFYLAFVADRSGSTLPTMLGHFVNNAAAVLAVHMTAADAPDEPFSWPVLAAGVAVSLACIEGVRRTSVDR